MPNGTDSPFAGGINEVELEQEIRGLLKLDATQPNRLRSRENSRLEYKQSFNWSNRAKYAKALAAFANNSGGFIVFGVKDRPHDIVGVNTSRFDGIDPGEVTEYLNSTFAPELEWAMFRIELVGHQLGVMAVLQAQDRPVVCLKNQGDLLREADIYYRYRGRNDRIKYPELVGLLSDRQERERNAWLDHLARVAKIGVDNVGVLDLIGGELSGPAGRLLVGEDLLDRVQFIRKGRFAQCEDEGMPTLRVIGDVVPIAPGSLTPVRRVPTPMVIGEKEILLAFLLQQHVEAPREYLKQICRGQSIYQPAFHFARQAGMSLDQVVEFADCETHRSRRSLLVNRLRGRLVESNGTLDGGSKGAVSRRELLEHMIHGNIDGLRDADRTRLFESIIHYEPNVPPSNLLAFLADIVREEWDDLTSTQRTTLRKAIAHLDEVINRGSVVNDEGV